VAYTEVARVVLTEKLGVEVDVFVVFNMGMVRRR
jgi:hypothetical protein